MKATPFLLTLSFVSIVLVIATIGSKSYLKASAKSTDAQSTGGALPSFLEKGKTYTFSFAASSGSEYGTNPVTVAGKIEKFDGNSGWIYINYLTFVTTPKKKQLERRFEGYGWINVNQA